MGCHNKVEKGAQCKICLAVDEDVTRRNAAKVRALEARMASGKGRGRPARGGGRGSATGTTAQGRGSVADLLSKKSQRADSICFYDHPRVCTNRKCVRKHPAREVREPALFNP